MADSNFRKLDVDQYDEDRVLPSDLYDPDPRGSSKVSDDAKGKQNNVRILLQRGDSAGALRVALEHPAYGDGVDEAKNVSLSVVLSILNSTKSTDIPTLIASLDTQEQVTLMKYLYKAMENLGDTNGNVILGWHEKLVEHAGTGCIVRVMTDHRRV